jgi:hypothetical protein
MEETTPIIKRVDHIAIKIDGPAYEQLFQLFTELFRFPIAWMTGSYPPFKSGGIFAGNVNLDFLQFENAATSGPPSLAGLALEPYGLEESLLHLKQRNISYLPPIPFAYADENGERVTYWTTVILGNLLGNSQWLNAFSLMSKAVPSQIWQRATSNAAAIVNARTISLLERALGNGMVFLCEYNPQRYAIAEDRAANQAVLRARNGGPLGLEAVKEIVIGATDFATTNVYWHNLFVPEPALQNGRWQIGDGPAIRLIAHEQNGLLRMVWRVSSLEKARIFLAEQDMLGQVQEQQIRIAPEKVAGLDIRLVS